MLLVMEYFSISFQFFSKQDRIKLYNTLLVAYELKRVNLPTVG